jgi:hypothetical protein
LVDIDNNALTKVCAGRTPGVCELPLRIIVQLTHCGLSKKRGILQNGNFKGIINQKAQDFGVQQQSWTTAGRFIRNASTFPGQDTLAVELLYSEAICRNSPGFQTDCQ